MSLISLDSLRPRLHRDGYSSVLRVLDSFQDRLAELGREADLERERARTLGAALHEALDREAALLARLEAVLDQLHSRCAGCGKAPEPRSGEADPRPPFATACVACWLKYYGRNLRRQTVEKAPRRRRTG